MTRTARFLAWLTVALVVILVVFAPVWLPAQAPLPPGVVVIAIDISAKARGYLASRWDDTKDPQQTERAYCLYGHQTWHDAQHMDLALDSVAVADSLGNQTPYTIDYYCPSTALADLHTHTPTSCAHDGDGRVDLASCVFGGNDAWVCAPSPQDQQTSGLHTLLSFVQCDRYAWIPYMPARAHAPVPPTLAPIAGAAAKRPVGVS